jgi:hypothetical protein
MVQTDSRAINLLGKSPGRRRGHVQTYALFGNAPNQIEQALAAASASTTAPSRVVAIASLATFLFLPPHFDSIAPDETPEPFASPDYFGVVDLNCHFVFRSRYMDFCPDAAT